MLIFLIIFLPHLSHPCVFPYLTVGLEENINPPEYLQSNYVLVFLILVLYCLISSPLLLIVIAGAGGAAYFASIKNETRKIAIAGTTLN